MRLTGAAAKPIQRKRRHTVNLSDVGSEFLTDQEGEVRRLAVESERCRPKRFVAVMAVAGTVDAVLVMAAAKAVSGTAKRKLSSRWRQTMNAQLTTSATSTP